jgi:hypothetical protein
MQTHIPFLEARERSRFLKLFWTEKKRSFRTRRYPRSDRIWGRRRLSISNMYLLNAAVYPDEGRSVLEVELEIFHATLATKFLAHSRSATTSNAV